MLLHHGLISVILLVYLSNQIASAAPRDSDTPNYLPKSFNLNGYLPDGRIINGTLASAATTKHQVSIRRRLNDGYYFGTGHICGGSLIAPNLVLSAAHCFVDSNINDGSFVSADKFIAVMGSLDRFNQSNSLVYDIDSIVYAVAVFNSTTYENDIALVFLNASVPANHSTVQPILLNRDPLADGTVCQVTGWGLTEDGYLASYLMTVDVPIINTNVCANDSDFSPSMIHDGMLCAGYLDEGERDACGGDSGGPLVCQSVLGGIVSWGIGCAEPKLPGVYTNVSYWSNWIDEQAAAKNITVPGGNDSGGGDGGGGDGGGGGSGGDGGGGGSGGDGGGGGGAAGTSFRNTWLLVTILLITTTLANRNLNV